MPKKAPIIASYQLRVDDARYVGSTCNLKRRKTMHLLLLRRGEHPNKKLQAAYHPNAWITWIEFPWPTAEQAIQHEQELIDLNIGSPTICNVNPKATGASDETRDKMAASKRGAKNHRARKVSLTFPDGSVKTFECVSDAAAHLNVQQQVFDLWLQKNNWPGTGPRKCRDKYSHLIGIKAAYEFAIA